MNKKIKNCNLIECHISYIDTLHRDILNETVSKYQKRSILFFIYLTLQICNMTIKAVTEKWDKKNYCYMIR